MDVTLEAAERPVFEWRGFGGLPDDIAKGEWFEDPSGKLRKAMCDIPKGHVPWLDPVDVGAFMGPPEFTLTDAVTIDVSGLAIATDTTVQTGNRSLVNLTGIHPTENKVLVLPDEVDEFFPGTSIRKPVETAEKDKWATTQGLIIAVSPLAFNYASPAEWEENNGEKPKPGQRCIFAKYSGLRVTSKRDGKDYLLLNDKDVAAVLEE